MLPNRKQIRIPYLTFQKIINDFTQSGREFTTYSADKLEWILYYHSKNLIGYKWHRYDTVTEEAVFLEPWSDDVVVRAFNKAQDGVKFLSGEDLLQLKDGLDKP